MPKQAKIKPRKYARCENCGGEVVERLLRVDRRFDGKLHEFENVPVGVCRDCGNRIYKGKVLEQLGRLSRDKNAIKKTLRVPVRSYAAG